MRIAVRDTRYLGLDPRTAQCQHRRLQVALQFQSLPSNGGWETCPLVTLAAPQGGPVLSTRLLKLVTHALLGLFNRF